MRELDPSIETFYPFAQRHWHTYRKMWPFRKNPLKQQVASAMRIIVDAPDGFQFFKALKQAREALVGLPREARPHLVTYLSHRNPWARRYAGTALAVHMDKEVLDLLLKGIRSKDTDVMPWFAAELARSSHPEALAALESVFSMFDSNSRCSIFRGFRENRPKDIVHLLLLEISQDDNLDSLRERICLLAECGELGRIAEAYDSFSQEQLKWIIRSLASIDDDLDTRGKQTLLGRLLLEEDDEIAWDAVQAINPQDLSDAALRPVFEKLLKHGNHRIKSRAEDYLEVIDLNNKRKTT